MSSWRKYNGAIIPKCLPHEEVDIHDIDNQIQSHNFARWVSNFDKEKKQNFGMLFVIEKWIYRNIAEIQEVRLEED